VTNLARWVAVVLIDGLDLVAHLTAAYRAWRDERAPRGAGAVTTERESR
jgi:hypothetical protein